MAPPPIVYRMLGCSSGDALSSGRKIAMRKREKEKTKVVKTGRKWREDPLVFDCSVRAQIHDLPWLTA